MNIEQGMMKEEGNINRHKNSTFDLRERLIRQSWANAQRHAKANT